MGFFQHFVNEEFHSDWSVIVVMLFSQEYRDLTDKLADLQTRHHNLVDVLEEISKSQPVNERIGESY